MSGIFKGGSIYKSGGGGGGFKDGGQLVDGDFIKVENNTVSSYDNVSRDPVNFYFEVKDGEILNSVVELTTAVNATINVYILKNGFYYLLGNVGGNTVNAGDDYKVNITGDSYAVEQVSTTSKEPKFVSLMGYNYGLVKIGSRLWTEENFRYRFGDNYYLASDGTDYQQTGLVITRQYDSIETRGEFYYSQNALTKIQNLVSPQGFRVPNRNDILSLQYYTINQLTSLQDGGTNETGFNARFKGKCNISWGSIPMMLTYNKKPFYDYGNTPAWLFASSYDRYAFIGNYPLEQNMTPTYTHQMYNSALNSDYISVRLCMDA